ncbi:MAG: hypothetical protein NC191_08920 [Muribaculaceae bacterium]|nr:hypothetical protein [Muribaculaceae bacterium]
MINNVLQNIMMSRMNPQMRSQIENIHRMAMQGGNPEQYLMQQFGNDPKFQQVVNLVRNKSPEELNNYLGNIYNSFNKPNMA